MMNSEQLAIPTGPAAAAFVAAGIGCAALGVFTVLAEVSAGVKNFLNWTDSAGPLSGKTSLAIAVWLVSWIILHIAWKNRLNGFRRSMVITFALTGVGVIGTFPPFFLSFSH